MAYYGLYYINATIYRRVVLHAAETLLVFYWVHINLILLFLIITIYLAAKLAIRNKNKNN